MYKNREEQIVGLLICALLLASGVAIAEYCPVWMKLLLAVPLFVISTITIVITIRENR